MVIRDARVASLLADKTRRQMLRMLKIREMSVNQLAKALGKPASSIAHHMRCLKAVGLVEPAGERRRGNLVERFYRASARYYVVSYTIGEEDECTDQLKEWAKMVAEKAVSSLESFSYKPVDRARVSKLLNEFMALKQSTLEKLASRQVKPSRLSAPELHLLINLLTQLELHRNEKYQRLMEELSHLIVGG